MHLVRPVSPELSVNRLFDATLSAIRDFAYTFDRAGRFLYANKALLDLWGLSLEEAVGKNFFDLKYPDELAARLQRQIEEVFTTKTTVRDESPYLSPTGVYGVYEYIFCPVFNDAGEVEIVAGSTRDITRHKAAEQEIRDQQQRMDAALEAGNAGTWAWDSASDQLKIDRNVARIFGLSPHDVPTGISVGRLLRDVHPEDRERVNQEFRAAVNHGDTYHSEYRLVGAGKRLRWIVGRGTVHRTIDGAARSMTGTLIDVTERQQADRDMRFLNHLSASVSGLSTADEITRFTIKAVVNHLEVQRAYFFEPTPHLQKVLVTENWSRSDVPSVAGEYELLDFGSADWWEKVRNGAVAVNDIATEAELNERNYSAFDVHAFATVPYVREGTWVAGLAVTSVEKRTWTRAEIALLCDVIARIWPMIERARLLVEMRANQTTLARQRDILERIVRDAELPDILDSLAVEFERGAGRPCVAAILLASEDGKSLQTLGGTRADPPWLRTTGALPIGPTMASSGAAAYLRERVIVTDVSSSPLWERFREVALQQNIRASWSTPILSSAQNVLGTFSVYYREPSAPGPHEIASVDILVRTAAIAIERDRARKALEKSKHDLERANEDLEAKVHERTARLKETIAELEAFSYSISHDLRAPLRAMQGYASVLLEEVGSNAPPEQREYLDRIQRASQRLDHLINDILRYTRLTRAEVKLEPVNLGRLVRDVIREYPQLHDNAVRVDVVEPLPDVLAHQVLLTQCLSNLLINAVKFVAPGVRPHIRVWSRRSGVHVRLSVQDNGIGLEPKNLTRIFGMFERVNPESVYEGTGIGLTIVKRAVERMGVESTFGEGSRFWIDLPEA